MDQIIDQIFVFISVSFSLSLSPFNFTHCCILNFLITELIVQLKLLS